MVGGAEVLGSKIGLEFEPVWFDSLGAKSSCTLVKTPDISILIDPGVAVMQPSFPASKRKKDKWLREGRRAVREVAKRVNVIIISHYHFDHFFPHRMSIYEDKIIFAKNPNEYINDSQRSRAENFYSKICKRFGKKRLEDVWEGGVKKDYSNPLEELELATSIDFGDYTKRKRRLLRSGMGWFKGRVSRWNRNPRIPELEFKKCKVLFPEGREFTFGRTKLRFTRPLFHGVEFSRVGWVFATVIEYGNKKLIHTSDLNGPIIEDYAQWIIEEDPDILILDGPMTYMLGYLLNRINLHRAIRNAIRILKETNTELIIYDHHLPREAKFIEHTRQVWDTAKELGKKLLVASELKGEKPKALVP